MGGGNAQKSAMAKLKNLKNVGKTDEERKAAAAKAKADAEAFVCRICRQTFMVNVKLETLHLHVKAKHPSVQDPVECFLALKDFDPDDPNGTKKAAGAGGAAAGPKKPTRKKKEESLDLLAIGLEGSKSKSKSKSKTKKR